MLPLYKKKEDFPQHLISELRGKIPLYPAGDNLSFLSDLPEMKYSPDWKTSISRKGGKFIKEIEALHKRCPLSALTMAGVAIVQCNTSALFTKELASLFFSLILEEKPSRREMIEFCRAFRKNNHVDWVPDFQMINQIIYNLYAEESVANPSYVIQALKPEKFSMTCMSSSVNPQAHYVIARNVLRLDKPFCKSILTGILQSRTAAPPLNAIEINDIAKELYALEAGEPEADINNQANILMAILDKGSPQEDHWKNSLIKLSQLLLTCDKIKPYTLTDALRNAIFYSYRANPQLHTDLVNCFKKVLEELPSAEGKASYLVRCCDFAIEEGQHSSRNQDFPADSQNPVRLISKNLFWELVKKLESENSKDTLPVLLKGLSHIDRELLEESATAYISCFPKLAKLHPQEAANTLNNVAHRKTYGRDHAEVSLMNKIFSSTINILDSIDREAAQKARSGLKHWSE